MSTAVMTSRAPSLADLLRDLGDISPQRVRLRPAPGAATEADVAANPRCELIDGVLVEKAMGLKESLLASYLIELLGAFVRKHKLGKVTAPDGTYRLMPGLIRIPDVAFISWSRLPGGRIPPEPAPDLAPDLAMEVVSEGNTSAELGRKIGEYFAAGVGSVWIIDRFDWSVTVYQSPDQSQRFVDGQIVQDSKILSEFSIPVSELFNEIRETETSS
jgi:Uma2 family endonuclease